MSTNPASEHSSGMHLATFAHEGLLWDAYLDFEDDPRQRTYRARLRFNRAGADGAPKVTETTVIIIEDSYDEAVAKARAFDDRQLEGLLRSTLPDPT
jgi:hypothetical protein